jgi:hypothetical protein
MPTYLIKDKKSGKVQEMFMNMTEMDEYLAKNPKKERVPAAPAIVSGVAAGRNKPDNGFRDILRTIKKHNRGSKINTFD